MLVARREGRKIAASVGILIEQLINPACHDGEIAANGPSITDAIFYPWWRYLYSIKLSWLWLELWLLESRFIQTSGEWQLFYQFLNSISLEMFNILILNRVISSWHLIRPFLPSSNLTKRTRCVRLRPETPWLSPLAVRCPPRTSSSATASGGRRTGGLDLQCEMRLKFQKLA